MFLNYLKQVRCLALGHSSHTLDAWNRSQDTHACVRVRLYRSPCRSWTLPVVVLGIGKRRRRRSEEQVAQLKLFFVHFVFILLPPPSPSTSRRSFTTRELPELCNKA
jgi:hypothetical protein